MSANSTKIVRGVICSEDVFDLNPSEGVLSDSSGFTNPTNYLTNLIELCNSYVLNDMTVISTSEGINENGLLTPLLREALANGDGIEIAKQFSPQQRHVEFRRKRDEELGIKLPLADAGRVVGHKYDLTNFWELANVAELTDQLLQTMESRNCVEEFILDDSDDEADGHFDNLSPPDQVQRQTKLAEAKEKWAQIDKTIGRLQDDVYHRMCHVSMLFADSLEADISLRWAYRTSALSTYADFLKSFGRALSVKRKVFHSHFEKFSVDIVDKLARPVEYDYEEYLRQPSFFFEALRQVDNPRGIGHVLREIRQSKSAEFYRELNRRRIFGGRERLKADEELRRWASDNFLADGLRSRIPAFEKSILGLSAPAVSWMLGAPLVGTVWKAGADAFDAVDLWLRNKRSTFVTFPEDQAIDLYVELKRVFGELGFTQNRLAGELRGRQVLRSR
jgi:hypothetical protein